MSYHIAIMDDKGYYKYHQVNESVYTYIRQLEAGVRSTRTRNILRKRYPFRLAPTNIKETI